MDEAIFQTKIDEIINEMDSVPGPQRKKIISLVNNTKKSHKQLKNKIDQLQQSLDYLRINIKYLLFDLEATRRENSYFKKMIEENGK